MFGMMVANPVASDTRPVGLAKVLVVDDNAANRLAVRKALRAIEVEMHEADCGFDALSLSLENDYALILLDVQMPEMDGVEVCARLRANPKTAETPVVLVTAAFIAAEDAISGYAEGATDYLSKPISDHILRAKVQVFLSLFRQRQALCEAVEAADRAKAEAERASLARSKFLAAASHDLRQPVQSLILLLDVLKAQASSPPVTKAVGYMENALTGLNGLLTGILDVSRLDAGVVMPQMQAVDAGNLLARLSLEYAVPATAKGLSLKCFSRGVYARTDPVLLERLLRNLIENALRYTHEGGILLGMRCRGEQVRLDVIDTGIGISTDDQHHIFEEFYQVADPGRDQAQGLGLGLSIVARIARLMSADIQVASREGRGTRFSVLLPLDSAECRPSPSIVPTLQQDSGRILVIEDNASVRSGLQMMLEGWGNEVIVAASGEEALDLGAAEGWRLDAIVTDYRLGPGLSGTATANEMHSRAGRRCPTLVITGDTAPEHIAEVHDSGFKILHKPVGAAELRRKVAQLLRGAI